LFASARRIASFKDRATVLLADTPILAREGSGGTGRGCSVTKFGSRKPCSTFSGKAGEGEGDNSGLVAGVSGVGCVAGCVAGGTIDGEALGVASLPGGVCGDGRCVPGGAFVSVVTGRVGRAGGWRCSVPGGRVASRCVGCCCRAGGVCANVTAQTSDQSVAICKMVRKRELNINPKTPLGKFYEPISRRG